jgi:hypothetical protein
VSALTLFAALACLACFALPGMTWAKARLLREPTAENVIDSWAIGFAISFCVLFAFSHWRLPYFTAVLAPACLASAVYWVRRGRLIPLATRRVWANPLVWASLLSLAIRLAPLFAREFPLGWDPYFHLVLADRVLDTGRIIDSWRPYEDIALNYPVGSHVVLAWVSGLTRCPLHRVFDLAIVVFTSVAGLQVFAWVKRSIAGEAGHEIGLYAMLAFLFSAVMGSLAYALWGGLPNLMALCPFVALMSLLRWGGGRPVLFALLFISLSLIHHHVMLMAGGVLLWLWIHAGWIRRDDALWRKVTWGLGVTAVVGAPHFVPYAIRAATVPRTGIAGFTEPLEGPDALVASLGFAFAFFVLTGAVYHVAMRDRPRVALSYLQAIVAMLGMYALLQYGWRAVELVVRARSFAPFTPSRFLTDAVGPASVFAGLFAYQTRILVSRGRAVPIALMMGGLVFNLPVYQALFRHDVRPDRVEAYAWIRSNTDPAAGIVSGDAYATYVSRRVASAMPLPSSEYESMAVNRSRLRKIAANELPPAAFARPVLAAMEAGHDAVSGKVLWSHPHTGFRVIQLFP